MNSRVEEGITLVWRGESLGLYYETVDYIYTENVFRNIFSQLFVHYCVLYKSASI